MEPEIFITIPPRSISAPITQIAAPDVQRDGDRDLAVDPREYLSFLVFSETFYANHTRDKISVRGSRIKVTKIAS